MLEADAFQGYREYTKKTIAYAKYKIGSTYYNADIDRIEVTEGTSKMTVYLIINPPHTSKVTISEICLYDTGNKLFLRKTEAIELNPLQEGTLYLFKFDFKEES